MLDVQTFKIVIENTPLVSIALSLKYSVFSNVKVRGFWINGDFFDAQILGGIKVV